MAELRGLQLAGDPDAHQDGLPGPPPQRGRAAAGRPALQPPGHRIRDRSDRKLADIFIKHSSLLLLIINNLADFLDSCVTLYSPLEINCMIPVFSVLCKFSQTK